MLCHRLIARLDVKGANVVKGVQMEGLRVMGKPAELARRYADGGADELLYMDTVASLYGRNQLESLLQETTESVFIPVTVGGGVKTTQDARRLLSAGADKVAINTAAIARPRLIQEVSEAAGSQAVVLSIEARKHADWWEACTDNGRNPTGLNVRWWAENAVSLGAGEILVTSIDRDGTRKGFDIELCKSLSDLPVPVVACGGMGATEHLKALFDAGLTAAAFASVLHYGTLTIEEIKNGLRDYPIRQPAEIDFPYRRSEEGRDAA